MGLVRNYKNNIGNMGKKANEFRKNQSDKIMTYTWNEDIQSKTCYLYDYFHDSTPKLNYNIDSVNDSLKTEIEAKFIVNTYNSDNKDQVSYHLQFKPKQVCNVSYYNSDYVKIYDSEFPYGLYIDIPDNNGIYRRWLICSSGNLYESQFVTYGVLPCDYHFQWVYNNTKYQMWGVLRNQSSYNSGVWRNYRIETVEDQQQFIVPLNKYSETLFYNQRMIIDGKVSGEHIAWKISKTHRFSPNGLCRITLAQDKYNQDTDYIERDENGYIIGMWADYYETKINNGYIDDLNENLNDDSDSNENNISAKITYSGVNPQIKINGSYKTFTVHYYDLDLNELNNEDIGEWTFEINGEDVSSKLSILSPTTSDLENNQIKIKFIGSEDYLGEVLSIKNINSANVQAECEIEIVGM